MVITVIAFDLGGVLFSEGKSNSVQALNRLGYKPELVLPFLSSDKASALRRGELTDEQFWIEWLQYAHEYCFFSSHKVLDRNYHKDMTQLP